MTLPVLWHFPISHYNEKVRWTLDHKKIPHRREALFIDYLPRAFWKTGQATLPILLLGKTAIHDSTRIIAELEHRYPTPALYPDDPAQRQKALELEDYFDEELGPAIRSILIAPMLKDDPAMAVTTLALGYPNQAAVKFAGFFYSFFRGFYSYRHALNSHSKEQWRRQVIAGLDRIHAMIQPSGFLVGDRFSIADLTAASMTAPLIWPEQCQYRPPQNVLDKGTEILGDLSEHPALQWTREIYRTQRNSSAEVSGTSA